MFLKLRSKYSDLLTFTTPLFYRIPLAWRITAWYSLFLAVMLFLFSSFVIQFTIRLSDSEMRSELQSYVVAVAQDPESFRSFDDGIFSILYTDDGIIARGAVPEDFPLQSLQSPNRISEITVKQTTFYYYDARIKTDSFDGWIRSITPSSSIHKRERVIFIALLIGCSAFLLLGSYGGYLLIKRGLRPVRQAAGTAAQIGLSKDLSRRIPVDATARDEISDLISTFNSMLDSLEDSSIRERRFSSDISHELRTPLSVIQAESDYSRKYVASVDEAKESFETIFTQTKSMSGLMSELLQLARLENLASLPLSPIHLSETVSALTREYETLVKNDATPNISITSDISPDIYIQASEPLLRRAVGNLIDNAIKFAEHSVRITLTCESGTAVIRVQDDGVGIESTDLPKIWDRLYQAESSRTKTPGSSVGLGLHFCKNIITLHHGTVAAESESSSGTVFTFRIPLIEDASSARTGHEET